MESFDRLAGQLSTEYDEKIRKRKLLDAGKINLIFNKFLKEAIMDKHVLKEIHVDKSRRPLEEQINFDMTSATSLKWLRRFSADPNQHKLGAKLNEKLKLNIDEEKLLEQLDKQISLDEEKFQDVSEPIVIAKTTTTITTTRIEEQNETLSSSLIQQQVSETKDLGSCGVTPPPTPQNELSSEATFTKAKTTNSDDEKRIVLNTVKEPPIVFLSDFETDNKISQAKQKVENAAEPAVGTTTEPVTSTEVTVAILKKGEEVNVPGLKQLFS